MFMTLDYAKLLSENPQPLSGGGMTTINIREARRKGTDVFIGPLNQNTRVV